MKGILILAVAICCFIIAVGLVFDASDDTEDRYTMVCGDTRYEDVHFSYFRGRMTIEHEDGSKEVLYSTPCTPTFTGTTESTKQRVLMGIAALVFGIISSIFGEKWLRLKGITTANG